VKKGKSKEEAYGGRLFKKQLQSVKKVGSQGATMTTKAMMLEKLGGGDGIRERT